MHTIIQEVETRVEALGFPVWVADATGGNDYPYVVLLPPGGGPSGEVNLAGDRSPTSDTLRVMSVGLAPEQAGRLQERTRTVLTRDGGPLTFDAPGWRVTLVRWNALPMTVDRDVTVSATGTHPILVIDEYELTAVPLPIPAPVP